MLRSICIPSNRNLKLVQENIETTLHYVQSSNDIELVIADNSNDKSKESFLGNLKNDKFNYLISEFKKPTDNFFHCLNESKGKFVSNIGDDDKIIRLGDKKFENISDDVVGFRPSFVVYTKDYGVINFSNFSIIENSALLRINEYFKKNGGNNNTLYSFFKKNIVLDVQKLIQKHPFRNTGYFDWSIVLAYIAEGKIISDPSTVIFYDNTRWTTTEQISSSITDLFINEDLNPKLADYLFMLLAIDSFILLARKNSRLDYQERFSTAFTIMNSYLDNFFKSINTIKFDATEINMINQMMSYSDFNNKFRVFLKIIDYLSPGKSAAYEFFMLDSTDIKIS